MNLGGLGGLEKLGELEKLGGLEKLERLEELDNIIRRRANLLNQMLAHSSTCQLVNSPPRQLIICFPYNIQPSQIGCLRR